MTTDLKDVIDAAFEDRQNVKPGQKGEVADAVEGLKHLGLLCRMQAGQRCQVDPRFRHDQNPVGAIGRRGSYQSGKSLGGAVCRDQPEAS